MPFEVQMLAMLVEEEFTEPILAMVELAELVGL